MDNHRLAINIVCRIVTAMYARKKLRAAWERLDDKDRCKIKATWHAAIVEELERKDTDQ